VEYPKCGIKEIYTCVISNIVYGYALRAILTATFLGEIAGQSVLVGYCSTHLFIRYPVDMFWCPTVGDGFVAGREVSRDDVISLCIFFLVWTRKEGTSVSGYNRFLMGGNWKPGSNAGM
jgi:hypothetical protein